MTETREQKAKRLADNVLADLALKSKDRKWRPVACSRCGVGPLDAILGDNVPGRICQACYAESMARF